MSSETVDIEREWNEYSAESKLRALRFMRVEASLQSSGLGAVPDVVMDVISFYLINLSPVSFNNLWISNKRINHLLKYFVQRMDPRDHTIFLTNNMLERSDRADTSRYSREPEKFNPCPLDPYELLSLKLCYPYHDALHVSVKTGIIFNPLWNPVGKIIDAKPEDCLLRSFRVDPSRRIELNRELLEVDPFGESVVTELKRFRSR
jgi:hypothetical protein